MLKQNYLHTLVLDKNLCIPSVYGVGKVEAGLSDYYLVEEVQATVQKFTLTGVVVSC